jgi:hypothetical protein
MKKDTLKKRFLRAFVAVAMGSTAFQLSGCDTNVRNALLSGLEDTTGTLADALITAFFLSLQNNGSSSGVSTSGI